MLRALLVGFLLSAQLVSCNAAPLFLCLDGDGALCIDLGPASCACGQHEHNSQGHAGDDGPAHEHSIGGSSGDCTHVQITAAASAVIVAPDGNRPVDRPGLTAVCGDSRGMYVVPPSSTAVCVLSSRLPVKIARRLVVLRC